MLLAGFPVEEVAGVSVLFLGALPFAPFLFLIFLCGGLVGTRLRGLGEVLQLCC